MKIKLSLLALGSMILAACGPYRPLGLCPDDGLFYYRLQGNVLSATPQEVVDQGFDPYAYGEYCPGGTSTPTSVPPTATPTDLPPTETPTTVPPTNTPTSLPPTATALSDTPTATPTLVPPTATPEAQVVIERMWLIYGVVTDQPFDRDYMRWHRSNYCILISDTHPSVEQQTAKCFPPYGWYPLNADCAGPVYDDDTWTCDRNLERVNVARLTLKQLCNLYPEWCDRKETK